MEIPVTDDEPATRSRRSDATRNQEHILEVAATVFVELGVDAPVRTIAERAGVGMGTLYRHFPTRAELVIAVYRHQVDAAADAGPELSRTSESPVRALHAWVDLFVDFLVTKHGLAHALHGERGEAVVLHRYFIDRLVPVCAELLQRAAPDGSALSAFALLRGIGNLCIGGPAPHYHPAAVAHVLVDGALRSAP